MFINNKLMLQHNKHHVVKPKALWEAANSPFVALCTEAISLQSCFGLVPSCGGQKERKRGRESARVRVPNWSLLKQVKCSVSSFVDTTATFPTHRLRPFAFSLKERLEWWMTCFQNSLKQEMSAWAFMTWQRGNAQNYKGATHEAVTFKSLQGTLPESKSTPTEGAHHYKETSLKKQPALPKNSCFLEPLRHKISLL